MPGFSGRGRQGNERMADRQFLQPIARRQRRRSVRESIEEQYLNTGKGEGRGADAIPPPGCILVVRLSGSACEASPGSGFRSAYDVNGFRAVSFRIGDLSYPLRM